jgi:2-dehydro-3-deoxyphosphogluconate aldolase/(4S)-4-hydroxy-2-oxoglutarate aldolase
MDVLTRLGDIGVVPVVEVDDPARALELGEALLAGGLPAIEVTFRTSRAIESMAALRGLPGLVLLAGTVTQVRQVAEAQEAGAALLVAPGLGVPVVEEARRRGIPILPGVATPSDIDRAQALGLDAVKVFPAELLGGTSFLRSMDGPFAGVRWAPSGGITIANLGTYLELDSVLACGGSWIAPRDEIAAGEFQAIEGRAREAVSCVRASRTPAGERR